MNTKRQAQIERNSKETQIKLSLNLDGVGQSHIKTPVPFLSHMLDQLARHGRFDLDIDAKGDIDIDDHHTVEDVGIVLGQAFNQALGDKGGLVRFAHFLAPLDEALSQVVVDISNRAGLFYQVQYTRTRVGNFDLDLIREFFQGFVNHALITLHIDNLKGVNSHHQAESIFKALAKALHQATRIDATLEGRPASTKEML